MNDNIKAIIETTLKAEIVKALNAAPDAIEKLITAAITMPVDPATGTDRGYGSRVPYLDFLIGQEIRSAARKAVMEVFAAQAEEIKAKVKEKFSSNDIVDAFAKALVQSGQESWRIDVKFEAENS